jgi:transposase
MTLRPQSLPPVPEATVAAVQAAFPKGNLSVEFHAEFGPLYDDQLFADLYLPSGRAVEVAPWRLALVKGSGALICAGVGILAWRVRTSSNS